MIFLHFTATSNLADQLSLSLMKAFMELLEVTQSLTGLNLDFIQMALKKLYRRCPQMIRFSFETVSDSVAFTWFLDR